MRDRRRAVRAAQSFAAIAAGGILAFAPCAAAAAVVTPGPRVDGPLAFTTAIASPVDLQNLDGSGFTQIVPGLAADPAWSADGQRLAYIAAAAGISQVFVIDADGKSPAQQVTHDPAGAFDPTWSPAGDAIAFTSIRDGNQEIYSTDLSGQVERRLTDDPGVDRQADWAPTGDLIAFESDRAGSSDIWIMAPDGSDPRRLVGLPGHEGDADWSPDGQRVAFAGDTGAATQAIFVTGRSGAPITQLTTGNALDSLPAWSPDGRQIAFTREQSFYPSTWVMPATGETPSSPATEQIPGTGDADWGSLPPPPATPAALQSDTAAVVPVADNGSTGPVTVTPPDGTVAVPLVAGAQIETGSTVDATKGAVDLTANATPTQPATANVAGGRFTVDHAGGAAPAVVLRLRDRRSRRCPGPKQARAARPNPSYVWQLRLRTHGKVRTITGDVRLSSFGTSWRVMVTCHGTTLRVVRGTVFASRPGARSTVAVHAGHSLFVRRVRS